MQVAMVEGSRLTRDVNVALNRALKRCVTPKPTFFSEANLRYNQREIFLPLF